MSDTRKTLFLFGVGRFNPLRSSDDENRSMALVDLAPMFEAGFSRNFDQKIGAIFHNPLLNRV